MTSARVTLLCIACCIGSMLSGAVSRAQPRADSELKSDPAAAPVIVSRAVGLPAWTEADVDALRKAVLDAAAARAACVRDGLDTREADEILGNFVGQHLVRGIALEGDAALDGTLVNEPGVANSVLDYLHYYENYRRMRATPEKYEYRATKYPPEVIAYVEAHGRTLAQVQALDAAAGAGLGGIAGGPGCYNHTDFARGVTLLSGATVLWQTDNTDDDHADVPLGFGTLPWFHFPSCLGGAGSTQVRVSSNGYLTFFELGGGALEGDLFLNDPIPDNSSPAAFVAPWWDDLMVMPAQGAADKISYKTEGSAPHRVFTVEYASISRRSGDTTDFHTFQVKLFEYDQSIEFHYALSWSADSIDGATVGMEGDFNAYYECGPNCGNANNLAPPNNYRYHIYLAPQDECPTAYELCAKANQATFRYLMTATNDGDSTCDGTNFARDIWFKFRSPCTGTVTFKTCFNENEIPVTDPVLSIHSGCPGTTLNQIACNDNIGLGGDCHPRQAQVSALLNPGQVVYVRQTYFGNSLAEDTVDLNCTFVPSNPPANDDCPYAQLVIPGQTYLGNVACATHTDSILCGGSSGDLYYKFTAPTCPGTLHLSACGTEALSGVASVISVYSSCPATYQNEIACVTDFYPEDHFCNGGPETDAQLDLPLQAGQQVLIRVALGGICDGYDDGRYLLHVDYTPSAAAPANDICEQATPIHCNSSISGTTCGASIEPTPFCGVSQTAPGVWYVTQGDGQIWTASTCSSNYDTKLSVFRGFCLSLTCVGGDDDDPGCGLNPNASRVTWQTTPGEIYLILVHGFTSWTGEFELTLTGSAAPPNDHCVSAQALPIPSTVFGNLTCADQDVPGCASVGAGDVWYSVTVPCDGTLVVDTLGTQAISGLDSTLSLYATCGGAALECNDDCPNIDCGPTLDARLTRSVQAGEQYLVRVSHLWAVAYGAYVINVTVVPSNDNCAAADAISDGSTPFCTYGANTDGPLSCLIRSDIWFRYRASCTGLLKVDTCGSAFDTALAVYNGWGCPVGPEAYCSNNDCGDDAKVTFPVTTGQLLLFRVGGPLGSGQGVLNIACTTSACDGFLKADANCDGLVNNFDIDPFVFGILNLGSPVPPIGYNAVNPNECWDKRLCWGDTTCDGLFNNFDIDGFVACVLAPGDCTPCPAQACCLGGGACSELAPAMCVQVGGTLQGNGTNCGGVICP